MTTTLLSKDELIFSLQKQIDELKTIISMMPGNVYWKNVSGQYLGCNNNMAEILNLTHPDDLIGKNSIDLIGDEMGRQVTVIDNEVLQTQKEKCLEELGLDDDGAVATYLTQKKPFYDRKGNLQGMLGISFDITDRKKMEEKLRIAKQKAESANRAKSRFLAMISHELRTPLTSILGFASFLEKPNIAADKKQDYINHIINSGSYLLSLINSLLDYNKLETNKYELINLPLNLKELIKNVMNMLSGWAELKKLSLYLEYEDTAPQEIQSNSKILRQILINLIGNAIKFTEQGYVAIKVKHVKTQAGVTKLEIAVEDTGIGIPANEQQSIFKRFYQLGNVYARNTSLTGTGLGLAIVKKLVHLLGGKIQVSSTPNEGSIFYFTAHFPLASIENTPWLAYAACIKILLVQDHKKRNIENLLQNTLFEIVSSSETLSTLLTAHHSLQPFEIIMLDAGLENVTANELIKTIREQRDLHQPLAFLLTTNEASAEQQTLFAKVINPKLFNPCDFQFELKNAWEKWQAKSEIPLPIVQTKKPYVLLVEDNELIQIVHKEMLVELGCEVDVTESAEKTFAMLKNNYDMLFVDIGLPDVAGFELIKTIRKQKGKEGKLPIVVLTGYSEDEERQHCLRVGANEVSVKPVSIETLKEILKRYVKN